MHFLGIFRMDGCKQPPNNYLPELWVASCCLFFCHCHSTFATAHQHRRGSCHDMAKWSCGWSLFSWPCWPLAFHCWYGPSWIPSSGRGGAWEMHKVDSKTMEMKETDIARKGHSSRTPFIKEPFGNSTMHRPLQMSVSTHLPGPFRSRRPKIFETTTAAKLPMPRQMPRSRPWHWNQSPRALRKNRWEDPAFQTDMELNIR